MGVKLDKRKRYAATRGVQNQGTLLVHAEHELWRALNVERGGLTEKEQQYLEKRLAALKSVREDIGKLGTHMQRSL